jgi:D-tyrosyl-tRNA(Tyr) deacylase
MKAVLQRVIEARVEIFADARADTPHTVRRIERGFAVLLGVAKGDTRIQADKLVDKMAGLRVFADAEAKMNLDIRQAEGSFLLVSQFTLLADTRKGRRPSFIPAADPATGEESYHYTAERLRAQGFTVETGEFGAHMVVHIANDGPVTILLDTDKL